MAELLLDEQSAPSAPSSGTSLLFPHNYATLKQWALINSDGRVFMLPGIKNWNTADVVANAADTYLTGSALAVPAHGLQVGTTFKWRMFFSKTAAGTVAPIWRVRIGTLGTTGDAAILTFTGVAQTAAVDNAFVEITAILRSTGAAGVLAGGLSLQKAAVTAVGITNTVGGLVLQNTSAGFNTTTAGLIVGVTVNPGTAGVWTHQLVKAEMLNI